MKNYRWLIVVVVAFAMIAAACAGDDTADTTATTAAPDQTTTTAAPSGGDDTTTTTEAMMDEGSFLDRAMAGEFSGTVVTGYGPFEDEDIVKFEIMAEVFEDATGIDIQYTGSKEFEATINTRVDAGDAPDIADFPQPGLLAQLVKTGSVVDLSQYLDRDDLLTRYNEGWLDMSMMESPSGEIMAGVWERVNGKSLVWYPKDDFDAAGYEVPTTWDEMIALSEQILADGDAPWCVGIESGVATGWAATDWMEEIMLRTTSLENYDLWTSGQLGFASPEVKHAAEVMSEIWLTDGWVLGGAAAIATTSFGDAPAPMFEDPPKCWLHKQGNFITSFFETADPDAEAGVDYEFFYMPGIDPAYGEPVLVAGDIWAAFSDRPEVIAVMEWFTYGEHLKPWIEAGGAIGPHLDSSLDWYGDPVTRGVAEIILNASSVRFDGSDLMPGVVGAGSFWKGMTDLVSGTKDLDTILAEIDASWPSS